MILAVHKGQGEDVFRCTYKTNKSNSTTSNDQRGKDCGDQRHARNKEDHHAGANKSGKRENK